MVDKERFPTKEERRQRQRRLERAVEPSASGRTPGSPPAPAGQIAEAQEPRAGTRHKPVTAADVKGLKYFEKLGPLLERLHDVGCERDKAGNRDLHYDQLCLFLLLGLFNPVMDH